MHEGVKVSLLKRPESSERSRVVPIKSSATKATSDVLTDGEVRLIAHLLSPDYLASAARSFGGDPVAGIEPALREVQGMLRPLLRWVYRRGAAKGEVRTALEALGYRGRRQDVIPLRGTPWRQTAIATWDRGCPIDSAVTIQGVPEDQSLVFRAVLRSLGRLVAESPHLNRAVLEHRLWQRTTPEIMLHVRTEPDQIDSVVIDVSDLGDAELRSMLRGEYRRLKRRRAHRYAPIGDQIIRAWLQSGFLVSTASCMVTDLGSLGIEAGYSAIVPGNGIPLAVAVGKVIDGRVNVGTTIDHRALDGSHAGEVHEWLRQSVPRLTQTSRK